MEKLPPPKQEWALTREAFERLLSWLDPDRERAGERYEEIRAGLIGRFSRLGCVEAEDLANRTLDRVAQTLPKVINSYQGRREPYVNSVAHYIHLEYLKRPLVVPLPENDLPHPNSQGKPDSLDDELLDACMSRCMLRLPPSSREMILHYYHGERQAKIRRRKELAERLGIRVENLRLRAQRVRADLKTCILNCVESRSLT